MIEVNVYTPLHCECAIFTQVHNQRAIPYIGVSKPPCAFCNHYFKAYCSATNKKFTTRGTHGQSTDWRFPVLHDASGKPLDVNDEITADFCRQLRHRIADSWHYLRDSSLDSQSRRSLAGKAPVDEEKGQYAEYWLFRYG